MKFQQLKSSNEYFVYNGKDLVSLDIYTDSVEDFSINNEIWSCVNHSFSRYYASNRGNILRYHYESLTAKGNILIHANYFPKHIIDQDGYELIYALGDDKKQHSLFIHRMVLFAFSEPSSLSLQVNHIDGNKRNNDLSNLEWCTSQENIDHYWNSVVHEATRNHVKFMKSKRMIMNDGVNEKYVDSEEIEHYESLGWREGHSAKYKRRMHDQYQKVKDDLVTLYKDDVEIVVRKDEVSSYMSKDLK